MAALLLLVTPTSLKYSFSVILDHRWLNTRSLSLILSNLRKFKYFVLAMDHSLILAIFDATNLFMNFCIIHNTHYTTHTHTQAIQTIQQARTHIHCIAHTPHTHTHYIAHTPHTHPLHSPHTTHTYPLHSPHTPYTPATLHSSPLSLCVQQTIQARP